MPKKITKRFIEKDNMIIDLENNLMWEKEGSKNRLTFAEAVKYCKDLRLGEYKDWKLPTVKQLISIVDYEKYNPAINKIFKCESAFYWSSTKYAGGSGYAWFVDFYGGYFYGYSLSSSYCVRAVRQYSN